MQLTALPSTNWGKSNRQSFAIVLGLLLLFLLSGCADPTAQAQLEQFVALNQTALAAEGIEPGNRLLIQGVDGNLYTSLPDGSSRQAITNDASSLRQYRQPTWSPSGEQIAWTEVDRRSTATSSNLIVAQYNGLLPTRYETPFAPFYIHWSPDESKLAYLSSWQSIDQPSLALRLVDLTVDPLSDDPAISTVVEGQPLYFAWSPDGDRLLTHVSNERVEFRSIEGEGEALTSSAASFPAPQWSFDGEQLLYADGAGAAQRLILSPLAADEILPEDGRIITDYDESISFALNSTGDKIAYAISPSSIGTSAFGPLYVVEVESQRTRAIGNGPVIAFFWSPDGEKLAYLMIDDQGEELQLRWHVWDGTRSTPYAAVVPTRTFLTEYLAFFDQYARSMTIWSPDSRAFAYAAVEPGIGSRIWVQSLEQAEPDNVGRGVYVAWSPR